MIPVLESACNCLVITHPLDNTSDVDAAWNEKEDVKKDTCVRERQRAMKGMEREEKRIERKGGRTRGEEG